MPTLYTIEKQLNREILDRLAYGYYDKTHTRWVNGDAAIVTLYSFFYDNPLAQNLDIKECNLLYSLELEFAPSKQRTYKDDGSFYERVETVKNETDSGLVGTREYKSGYKSLNKHSVYSSTVSKFWIVEVKECGQFETDDISVRKRNSDLYSTVNISTFVTKRLKTQHKNYDAPRSKRGYNPDGKIKPVVDTRLATDLHVSHRHKVLNNNYFALSRCHTRIVEIDSYGVEVRDLAVIDLATDGRLVLRFLFDLNIRDNIDLAEDIQKYLSLKHRVHEDKYTDDVISTSVKQLVVAPNNVPSVKSISKKPITYSKKSMRNLGKKKGIQVC